jgi:hypothetical protein
LGRRCDPPALDRLPSQGAGRYRPGVQPDWQHPRDVRICVGDRHTRLQAREPTKAKAVEGHAVAIDANRQNDFGLRLHVQEPEALRHDADNLGRARVDGELPSDHRRVAAKPSLPVAIRQDHRAAPDLDPGGAARDVRFSEDAADCRLYAKRLKYAVGDGHHARLLRVADPGNGRPASEPDTEIPKDSALLAVREVLRRRHQEVVDLDTRRGMLEAHELLRVRVRQRFDQHAIDHGEDGCVCAKAQRQRQHDGERECRIPAHPAQGVSEIAPQRVEQANGVHLVDLLANANGVPELAMRGAPCFTRRHPAAGVFFGFDVEVGLQLFGSLAIPVRPPKETAPAHSSSVVGFRIRPIARTSCSHRVACATSCFRPAGVRR